MTASNPIDVPTGSLAKKAREKRETRIQADFSGWVAATSSPDELILGVPGFGFADLFEPSRLADLYAIFEKEFAAADPEAHARFEAYRACRGEGMTPEAVSEALLGKAPHVSSFVAKLFNVEHEIASKRSETRERDVLWLFKRDFSKKRLWKPSAGTAFNTRFQGMSEDLKAFARVTAEAVLIGAGAEKSLLGSGSSEEETAIARATVHLVEVDEVARKAAKAGGASWTPEL